jgi:hypothetical protein
MMKSDPITPPAAVFGKRSPWGACCPTLNPLLGSVLLISFLLIRSLLLPTISWAEDLDEQLPFQPGERLTYELKWTVIPAGQAVLEVQPMTSVNGVAAYHFVLTAKSTRFIDRIYKVRDRIEGFVDTEMTGSMLYKKKQREGSVKKDVLVVFDADSNQARYYKSGKIHKELPISVGTFDPLSAFYYSRVLDLKANSVIQKPVSDGKRWVIGKVHVVRREIIALANGDTYDTYLIEPDLSHVGGVFEKSKDAKLQLWVTADKRRIPVRIKSAVSIGSFTGELVAAQGLTDADRSATEPLASSSSFPYPTVPMEESDL